MDCTLVSPQPPVAVMLHRFPRTVRCEPAHPGPVSQNLEHCVPRERQDNVYAMQMQKPKQNIQKGVKIDSNLLLGRRNRFHRFTRFPPWHCFVDAKPNLSK